MKPKKHLGQHFLNSEGVLTRMVAASELAEGELVLEIGPGRGALTKHLLEAGARVIAVEKDDELIPELEETFSAALERGQLKLLHADALEVDYRAVTNDEPYKIIANIPYYITGALFRDIFSQPHLPEAVLLLIQKEVAERIARSEKESLLSLSIKAYGTPHYVETVPAGAFNPPPKVDSALLLVTNISRDFFTQNPFNESEFFSVLKRALAMKRKTLINNLFASDKEGGRAILKRLDLDEKIRAEALKLEDFRRLTVLLSEM